jgi:very-short-patch-repair endonuclease
LEEWKSPYLLDQLWIMLYPDRKVRLVCLEVDGEVHLEPEKRASDRRRAVMLAAMGYEIYRVAGW